MTSHTNEFLLQHTSTEDASSPENSMLGPGNGVFCSHARKGKWGIFTFMWCGGLDDNYL